MLFYNEFCHLEGIEFLIQFLEPIVFQNIKHWYGGSSDSLSGFYSLVVSWVVSGKICIIRVSVGGRMTLEAL